MIPYERRLEILQMLENKDIVNIEEFLKAFDGVSESTIRRDLKSLMAEGQITLLHGGGAKLKTDSYEAPVIAKKGKNAQEKEKIAKYAASLVNDGDSVYIDAGSTLLAMIKYLKNRNVTIVTSNSLVFPELQGSSLKCYIVGGEVNVDTASIIGTTTNLELTKRYFNKAFLGASAYSERAGISTPDVREAEKKQIVKENSEETYMLLDSSKEGRNTLCKIFDLGEVTIISDKENDTLKKCGNYIIAK